ncbi:MAG TPA: hypothetical protein VK202_02855 [Bacteroidia bacterium]|nr:hypothetical protein [Bacteroidia bacterium]
MKRVFVFTALSIVVGGVIYSCKHEPEPIPVKLICFEEEVLPVLRSNCASASGCHSTENPQKGIILDSYANIIASGTVKPFDPASSELYEVLIEDDIDDRMPLDAPPLSQDKIALIYNWIAQGAQNPPCTTPCDTVNVTFSNQVTKVLNGNCMGNCHAGTNPTSGFSLAGYDSVKVWVNNGRLLKSINHEDSLNVTPMPYSPPGSAKTKLNECNIRTLEIWIENGALNN